ncbi:DUF3606 domain-containing protein [Mesorhizobium sp.]|uniref:DUF3606 domain-containing protein n=1 Tax=Mesorhizobium sp. TaxID=1871066 RepID=UPI000FE398BD|nr:DUF3606 domain-containing protein [Mesorhizobium sp.]RWN99365.1 MAG: DUF3606 domain-containing protein [Mesorhizobium sp.]
MTDDKTKRDFRDRNRVSAEEDHEIDYFARDDASHAGRSARPDQAAHNERATLEREAKKLRR